MKKIILSIVILLTVLMTFVACNKNNTPQQEKTVYETLNDLSNQNYDKVNLNITTLTNDTKLSAFYVMTADEVSYSIEQLNLLPTDGDFSNLNPSYKSTIKGYATIANGKVVKMDNDNINLPAFEELKGQFIFNENYFTNVIVENGYFSADVTSPSGFLGTNKDVRDMKIVVNYEDSALQKITITYKTSISDVTNEYTFTK